ncbi:MAG: proprotein convertase P-domain-containing protein, partial [Actinomycetota bacterium]
CRFPDMYDYGKRDGDNEASAGIGRYCLMGSGNHLDNGRTPSPVSSYLRYLAGWTDDVVLLNADGTYEARHGAYDQAMKYDLGSPNEFFLVENRSRIGLDRRLPADGLAVYHCDTRGSNEWQDGTRQRHYQCALLQADGRKDLETNANRGDAEDLYAEVDQIALSHDTVPNTRRWDGSDSGLTISDISAAGETMTFTIGPPIGRDREVAGESFPNALIPDDDTGGVQDVIAIDTTGELATMAISASIVHTWVGDLTVTLIGPDGTRVALHERDGGSDDDLTIDLNNGTFPALDAFVGGPAGGDWTIEVVDGARRDVGRLLEWALVIGMTEAGDEVSGEVDADTAIPDDDAAGITSVITLDGAAGDPAAVITVTVDIEHTYIGDLQVDLVNPANTMVRLHGPSRLRQIANDERPVTIDRTADQG